jgi:hypothetical protein
MSTKKTPAKAAKPKITPNQAGTKKVIWDDSNMRTSFANVVNGTSTREEVSMFFGTNKTWNITDETNVNVQLNDRIILTPHAAKRMATLLMAIIGAYEKKYGAIKLDLTGN